MISKDRNKSQIPKEKKVKFKPGMVCGLQSKTNSIESGKTSVLLTNLLERRISKEAPNLNDFAG